jgi:hypothetical protein
VIALRATTNFILPIFLLVRKGASRLQERHPDPEVVLRLVVKADRARDWICFDRSLVMMVLGCRFWVCIMKGKFVLFACVGFCGYFELGS